MDAGYKTAGICKGLEERGIAKQLHGHRYARYRGLRRVSGQCLLAAACQNMKKIALLLARFSHPLAVLALLHRLWMLVGCFIEKNGLIGNPSAETALLS